RASGGATDLRKAIFSYNHATWYVDEVLKDDLEARALTRRPMLLAAAREIMGWGPVAVALRLGEYGCALLTADGYFSVPGYPLEAAADPTGCGDAFAGGFLGYLD